jgi:hypothetical protein
MAMLRFLFLAALAAALLFTLAPTQVRADVPCCPSALCTIDDNGTVILVPDADGHPVTEFTCRTHDIWDGHVVPHAIVEVVLQGISEEVGVCGGTVLTKTSDEQGYVTFRLSGGGCNKSHDAMQIRVNGISASSYRVVSPDYAGWDNVGEPGRWNLAVDPIDVAAFAHAYQGGVGPASCHDYNANGVTDPSDFSIFAQVYRGGTTFCSP